MQYASAFVSVFVRQYNFHCSL